MAIVSISRIQHRRGLQQDLPSLASAELGWSLDTQKLYIGNGSTTEGAPRTGVTEILTEHSDVLALAETYTFKNEAAGYTPATGGRNGRFNAIAYGNGLFVAVGANGAIVTSIDKVTWTPVYGGTSNTLNSIAYGNGLFVAVGASGTIIYSADGAVWNTPTSNIFLTLTSVAYAGGTFANFIAVSNTGTIISSTNGVTWTTLANTGYILNSVAYYNNIIVAVGNDGNIIKSTNGSSWTLQNSPTSYNLRSINFDNDRWIATGEFSTVLTSTDAITWYYGFTDTFRASANNGSLTIMVGDGGVIYYTTSDSTTPVAVTSPTLLNLYDVIYSAHDGQFVAVGQTGTILTSTSGTSWNVQTSGTSNNLNRIIYDSVNDRYITVGDVGTILTSSDAITWTTKTSGVTVNLYGIGLWAPTLTYIAVGASGTILTSANSTTWTARVSGVSTRLNSIVVSGNTAIIVGHVGTVLISIASGGSIGVTWNSVTPSGTFTVTDDLHHVNFITWTINAITYSNFFAVGNNATVIYSASGSSDTWTQVSVPSTNHLFNIQFSLSNFWILGSVGYSILFGFDATNSDSLNYESLAILQNNTSGSNGPTLNSSVYGAGIYLLVGQFDSILTSSDGTNFVSQTQRTFTLANLTIADIYSVLYANGQYTAVGNKGLILNSADSVSWTGISYTFGNNQTVRTIQKKLDDLVSIKDFGAKGDGLTDDTEAINRALYELYCRVVVNASRKILYFPSGTYIVSDGINVPSNAILRGEGSNNTIIKQTANPIYVSYVMTTADSKQQIGGQIGFNGASLPSDIIISDIGLVTSADGFWLVNASRVTLERVSFFGATDTPTNSGDENTGLYILGSTMTPPTDISLLDCHFEKFNYGVFQPGTEYSRNILFNSTTFVNMFKGLYLCPDGGQVNTMTLSNCFFDLIYNKAIDANYATNITSTFNSYRDVANRYLGIGNAYDYVASFGAQSVGCASINDEFDRSYTENLSFQWIFGNSTTSAWFGGHNLRVGYFSQQGGETHTLLPAQTSASTGLVYPINDYAYNQSIQYVILRSTYTRSGVLQLTYNSTANTYSLDDDSNQTGDVGVTFSILNDGTNLTLLYTSTSGGSSFTLAIAESYVKTVW